MLRQQIATMTQQLYDKSIKIKSLWIINIHLHRRTGSLTMA